ncbi:MAG: peptidoglycan editing factor PgeF [Burkholderiales bacterium]|nr:peptidoglycan editing factor PgeF [Burkholderiales bacterium]
MAVPEPVSVPGWRPDWPAPAHVHAWCSTRGESPADGASAAPYEFFNLGAHVGDAPAAVAANRARLQQHLGARPVFLDQVHGTQVLSLQPDTPDGATADAAVTTQPGLVCTVMVADCLPVLFTDAAGSVVAAAHAGWRGLAGGVLEQTLAKLRELVPATDRPPDWLVWLGPCIGPEAFEVGPEVRAAFVAHDAGAAACFRRHGQGKYLADLAGLARRRLGAHGIARAYGNDGGAGWCTVQQPHRYHSHRRDHLAHGGSGRMAACIWLA